MPRNPWIISFAAILAAFFAGFGPQSVAAATDPDTTMMIPETAIASLALPRVGGYIQARETAQEHVGLSAVLNRARFSIDGALPLRFAYRMLVETEASAGARAPATVSLREAIVRWTPGAFALTAGEFKTPFTREYLIPVPALELADLATAVDSLAPKYDVGMMGEVAIGPLATVSAGVFNGEGANTTANRDSNAMVVSRVTARPIPQLSVGASGARDAADSLRWGLDASAQEAGAVVRAEYLTRHRRGRSRENDDFGWYVFESFRPIPRLQLVARQEDFQRPSFGASRRVRGLAYGTKVEIAPNRVRVLLEFSRRIAGALQSHTDSFIAQAQVQF